jgi:hypothetical protein
MPAVSKKQRKMMAIAEHYPTKLLARNKGVLKMGKSQMRDFSKTKEKGLPVKKHRKLSTAEYIKRRNVAQYGK